MKELRTSLQGISNFFTGKHADSSDFILLIDSMSSLDPGCIHHASKAILEESRLSSYLSGNVIFDHYKIRNSCINIMDKYTNSKFLFLFHADGYLREAALDKISDELSSPFFVAAILLRLNDWVPPVRESALRCAERIFPKTPATVIAPALLALYPRTLSWTRWNVERSILTQTLCRLDVIATLAERIVAEPQAPVVRMLAALTRSPDFDSCLQKIAFEAQQPSVRAFALRTLIDGRARWRVGTTRRWIDKSMGQFATVASFEGRPLTIRADLLELCTRGSQDRSALVRKIALDGTIRGLMGTTAGVAIARSLVEDRSQGVRTRAEFVIRGQPT